ncbi:MAG TPA: hypothetical protein VE397_10785 [Stellaceae bacterium]|nr:hypothetical protein [Stellaceae bacterium]
MPFDGVILAPSADDVLAAACAASGIARLDYDRLERHKAEQVLRHAPSWRYRHRGGMLLAQAIGLALGVSGFMLLADSGTPDGGLVVLLATLGLVAVPMLVPSRGPAAWRERDATPLDDLHPEIHGRAMRLKAQLPEVTFRVGELYQERVLLDPYLLADHGGATVILGIWEGDRIIA